MMSAVVWKGCRSEDVRQVASIEWRGAGALPAGDDAPHPGLAGAVAGVHNDMLIVGGGANFPDGMPWHGGKKKYHSALYVFAQHDGMYRLVSRHPDALPAPVAYGASCSTGDGVVYAVSNIFILLVSMVVVLK